MKAQQKVDTIIFDLSEVYLTGLKDTHLRLSQHLGNPVRDEVFHHPSLQQLFHGKITEDKYWQNLIDEQGWQIGIPQLQRVVRKNFQPIKGTADIVRQLKKKGYRLGLLSVHAKEWIEYCQQQFDHQAAFDVVTYSYESGVSKPNSRAYRNILKKLDTTPSHSLMIDDSEINIRSAKRLGMQAIQFTSARQLAADLKEYQIL